MLWRNVNTRSRSLLGAVLVFYGLVASVSGVSAVDTEIGAVVCGSGAPGAFVQITQPANDSVVEQSTITLRGDVNNTAQVEVLIDGQQDSTVAIGSSQPTFVVDLTLSEGTHTIKVQANDICGGQGDDDSIVVTFQPQTEPSTGGTTPTTLDGNVTLDGSPVPVNQGVSENDFVRQIEQLPVIGAAVSVVSDFATAIGLESTVIGNNTPAINGVARVGITVAALTSVVMATSLAPLAAQAIPGVSEAFNVSSHRSMLYLGWIIRGIGVLAMAFAYFL